MSIPHVLILSFLSTTGKKQKKKNTLPHEFIFTFILTSKFHHTIVTIRIKVVIHRLKPEL